MQTPLHCHRTQIAFADTDASGWMHFPSIFRHVEAAEHDCLRERGVLVFDRERGGWPRVSVSCDFKHPLLTGDAIEVQLAVGEIGRTSIRWQFEVIGPQGKLAASGHMTNVRVDQAGRPQEISAAERQALEGS